MVAEPNDRQHEADDADGSAPGNSTKSPSKLMVFLDRHLTKKWLITLLAISIFGHGVGFAAYVMQARRKIAAPPAKEVDLGTFCFMPEPSEGSPVLGAEFDIHVVPLEDVDAPARRLLGDHQNRVRGNIEELLRRAHAGDFRDPALIDLKRQLQEQVNEALGMRAIAEVIVTNLIVDRPDELPTTPSSSASETAATGNRSGSAKPAG